jgi:DNA-binding response OmpR family regulator
MARIRTQLRRANHEDEVAESMVCGPIELRTDTAEVVRNGEVIPVSRIEFYVLAELIGAQGRVLSRDHLLRKVWGYGNAGDGRVVDNLIYRLRNKIEEDPANPEYLLTVRGFGYRMKA